MAKTLEWSDGDMKRLYTNSGYNWVEGKTKVKQDVVCMFTTDIRDSNGLGMSLDEVVGAVESDPHEAFSHFPIAFEFQSRVDVGLSRLKQAQRKYQYATRTPQELIYDYSSPDVWQDYTDPRLFRWKVDIITEDKNSSFSISGGSRK